MVLAGAADAGAVATTSVATLTDVAIAKILEKPRNKANLQSET
jgi:hypothetical protein